MLDKNMMCIALQATAMHYYNLFFLKKCYLNYDRETVLNACILIAAKVNNLHELDCKYLV
jgi:hypothetical protein